MTVSGISGHAAKRGHAGSASGSEGRFTFVEREAYDAGERFAGGRRLGSGSGLGHRSSRDELSHRRIRHPRPSGRQAAQVRAYARPAHPFATPEEAQGHEKPTRSRLGGRVCPRRTPWIDAVERARRGLTSSTSDPPPSGRAPRPLSALKPGGRGAGAGRIGRRPGARRRGRGRRSGVRRRASHLRASRSPARPAPRACPASRPPGRRRR